MLKAFTFIKETLSKQFDVKAMIINDKQKAYAKIEVIDWLEKYAQLAQIFGCSINYNDRYNSTPVLAVRLEFKNGVIDVFAPRSLIDTVRKILSTCYFDMTNLISIKTELKDQLLTAFMHQQAYGFLWAVTYNNTIKPFRTNITY